MAEDLPDVRDGLTRLERAILVTLARLSPQYRGSVPTMTLYGHVLDLVDCSKAEFEASLHRLMQKDKSPP